MIGLTLAMIRMWRDGGVSGRNPRLWIAVTLAAGSFGPLFHRLARKRA